MVQKSRVPRRDIIGCNIEMKREGKRRKSRKKMESQVTSLQIKEDLNSPSGADKETRKQRHSKIDTNVHRVSW
ncbi:hypothetical protein O3P69_016492 [Scylla paramamosain]|uniref:Uncharacterized protein n=1 Tax=Scylla paramamosain TaxID=85552 RepID=A0AAW0TF46_SCYPA